MNARQHLDAAETILAGYQSQWFSIPGATLDQSPGLVRALVHATLAGVLRDDGTLDQSGAVAHEREQAYLGSCVHCGHALYSSTDGRPIDETGEYLCPTQAGIHQLPPAATEGNEGN
jgi:hypothetical protein